MNNTCRYEHFSLTFFHQQRVSREISSHRFGFRFSFLFASILLRPCFFLVKEIRVIRILHGKKLIELVYIDS